MNFDLLVTILFILFFVLGPLFQRGNRQGKGRSQRPGEGERPTSPPPAQRADAPPREASAEGAEDPLSKRLEEARRRVLEAMGEAEGRSAEPRSQRESRTGSDPTTLLGREGTTPAAAPPAAPAPAGQPRQAAQGRAGGSTGAQGSSARTLDWQQVSRPVQSFIPEERPALRSAREELGPASPPVRTERRRGPYATARLSDERKLALDSDAILQGLIWHEILSEPVSKRDSRRRTTSRLRSR